MKISIVIPTNRRSLSASARVLEAAALDPDRFEIIVRDNSTDHTKRTLLSSIRSPSLRLFSVPDHGAVENFTEAQRLATGDFIYLVGDDDWFSTRGLEQLHARLATLDADDDYVCGTGDYLVETSTQTGIVRYSNLASASSHERLLGYLSSRAPNVLFYSAVRRSIALQCAAFLESLPYKLSFHDQLVSLIYLSAGKTMAIERVIYHYDLGAWESVDGTLSKDRSAYRQAGLPVEIDRLHLLLCGMEGALLLKSRRLSHFKFECDLNARLWFDTNFAHFKNSVREGGYGDNPINVATLQLRNKWLAIPEINISELLLDVCDVFELTDKPGAARYFDYWSKV